MSAPKRVHVEDGLREKVEAHAAAINASAVSSRRDPPFTTALKWCPVCGRTDRTIPFTGQRHSTGGKRCEGTPVTVVYEFKQVLPLGV